MEETITTRVRVTAEAIRPFAYAPAALDQKIGEVVELKASGIWGEFNFPISLHLTVPPGHPCLPFMGDDLVVTVTRG